MNTTSTRNIDPLDYQALLDLDRRHWVHPVVSLRQHESIGSTIWKSAEGIHLIDAKGRRVQDGFSGLWCVNAGYGQQSIVQAATAQLQQLPYATGYFHFASEPAIRLAARLCELAPRGLSHVLLVRGLGRCGHRRAHGEIFLQCDRSAT